ncbi:MULTISPECIES: TetR/AcrR family transcriptional regulator [Mumia]|uniref:TetR/AcrR family transcriptional regulator n=1 Tax=Mumia TaxID=1546255 RepID=UPI00141DF391|nr:MULTISPECIES: TetR/AcrR family transcriptional regulator [unclassified Mumia]QMW67677.1 TetR/AcrR family transcriptional regulator [Mumia sp. ZJ1417]
MELLPGRTGRYAAGAHAPSQAAAAPTRPRNRRQLIIDAAGRVFNERGYYAASMEEIADRVGITAPALYRHFPNKYTLFAECVTFMADGLLEALEELSSEASLEELFTAATRVTIAHRATGGVYRWEARYLNPDDRRVLRRKFAYVVGRVAEEVRVESGASDADVRAAAALGAIGSITMHRTRISPSRAEELLVDAALRVVATEPSRAVTESSVGVPAQPVPRTRRAEILAAAIPLFERDGFAHVTLGRIAEVVGIAPSAIYRHYPGKVDILAAACLQAAGLLSQAVDQALMGCPDPHDAVVALAATYVAYSFEHRALTSVAEAELAGLPAGLQRPLVLAQRDHIAIWEQQLRAVRPDLNDRQARVLVHAGFGVVVEAGRRLRWEDTPDHRSAVTALMVSALGWRPEA